LSIGEINAVDIDIHADPVWQSEIVETFNAAIPVIFGTVVNGTGVVEKSEGWAAGETGSKRIVGASVDEAGIIWSVEGEWRGTVAAGCACVDAARLHPHASSRKQLESTNANSANLGIVLKRVSCAIGISRRTSAVSEPEASIAGSANPCSCWLRSATGDGKEALSAEKQVSGLAALAGDLIIGKRGAVGDVPEAPSWRTQKETVLAGGANAVGIMRSTVGVGPLTNPIEKSIAGRTGPACLLIVDLAERYEAGPSGGIEGEGSLAGEAIIIVVVRAAAQDDALAAAAEHKVSGTAALACRVVDASSFVLEALSVEETEFRPALRTGGVKVGLAVGVDGGASSVEKQESGWALGAAIHSKAFTVGNEAGSIDQLEGRAAGSAASGRVSCASDDLAEAVESQLEVAEAGGAKIVGIVGEASTDGLDAATVDENKPGLAGPAGIVNCLNASIRW
jgi:hypothetical protein